MGGQTRDPDRLAQILDRVLPRKANGRAHILHVDDDPAVLEVVALALAATADVLSVNSLDDARRALAEHHFDLAVLDIDLGRLRGWTCCRSCAAKPAAPFR